MGAGAGGSRCAGALLTGPAGQRTVIVPPQGAGPPACASFWAARRADATVDSPATSCPRRVVMPRGDATDLGAVCRAGSAPPPVTRTVAMPLVRATPPA